MTQNSNQNTSTLNRKIEIRSTKFEANSKFQISKRPQTIVPSPYLIFGHSNLFRISDFGFRISGQNPHSSQFASCDQNTVNRKPAAIKVEKVCRSCRRNRRGAAVVEFAVVAPVFICLILGMIEVGRGVMVQQIITNASREGARVAVLDGAVAGDVETKVENYLTSARVPYSSNYVSITPSNPSSQTYGGPVTVTVEVPFSQVSWLPVPKYFTGNFKLSATSVMRREAVQ